MHEAVPLTITTEEKYNFIVSKMIDWIIVQKKVEKTVFLNDLLFWTAMSFDHSLNRVSTPNNESGYSKWLFNSANSDISTENGKSTSVGLKVLLPAYDLPYRNYKFQVGMEIAPGNSLRYPICEKKNTRHKPFNPWRMLASMHMRNSSISYT